MAKEKEEVKNFTGQDLERIAELLGNIASGNKTQGGTPFDPSTASPLEVLSQDEKAVEYYETLGDNLDSFPHKGIHVCDDKQRHIFAGSLQGENALANFIADTRDKATNQSTVSYKSYPKPSKDDLIAMRKALPKKKGKKAADDAGSGAGTDDLNGGAQ